MKHALLSPSSADKWFKCPAMPTLAAKVDYQVGLPAAVGTLIHSMTEQLLKGFLVDVTLEDYWLGKTCLLYTSPSPRDGLLSRMPSSA